MKKKFKLSIIIVIAILLVLLVLSLIFPKLSFIKTIDNIIYSLNIKDTEKYKFDININVEGNDNYNVIKESNLNGSYISTNGSYELNANFTSNYKDTINVSLYNNGEKTYLYDEYLNSNVVSKSTGKLDLSINNLKSNLKDILIDIKNSGLDKYITNKVVLNNNILTFKIDDNNINDIINSLDSIKLDNPYQYIIDQLITDINNNKDNYIGTEINIYTSLIGGKFKKIEIKNDNLITLTKDNGYNLEIIGKDNKIYKLNITSNNIVYTVSKGSSNILNITANITYDTNANVNTFDISNAIDINDMNSVDIINMEKNITSNKTKSELFSLYYNIIGGVNILDMNVTDGNYYIYYLVPDGYHNVYSGNSLKKYINYNQNIMLNYIASQYQDISSSGYYKRATKGSLSTINYNNHTYYYEIITMSYVTDYSDYDDTKSILYLWDELDNNTCFKIECDFQGGNITENQIINLLNIKEIK